MITVAEDDEGAWVIDGWCRVKFTPYADCVHFKQSPSSVWKCLRRDTVEIYLRQTYPNNDQVIGVIVAMRLICPGNLQIAKCSEGDR
jgi:hypothetical protein